MAPGMPSLGLPMFGGEAKQEPSFEEELCEGCPKMTYQQRLIGFCVCCGFGYGLSFIGTMILVAGGPNAETIRQFAALYIVGNFIAIAATMFLIGPRSQCRKMFDKCRRVATLFWLSTLVVTFAIAIAGVDVGLVLMMIVIQICASIWYTASYIPYGRRMIIKIFQSTCCKPCPKVCDPCIKLGT
ncbi:Got1/Sft2-like family-domain-containing protein [Pelagophyceae sp. CCMP2097]|nr:Got1/Sft2-like family-domain-containing protein [Pelagophyceae sp. CCMP2097]|mmetsp:Transcript_21817/g.73945  ORF Transcript_21817/g.73945 Transcript_21817/m.73945 type:complete len:185 (+) Transcript_21817:21-575(+)